MSGGTWLEGGLFRDELSAMGLNDKSRGRKKKRLKKKERPKLKILRKRSSVG